MAVLPAALLPDDVPNAPIFIAGVLCVALEKPVSFDTAGMFPLFTAHDPCQHLENTAAVAVRAPKKTKR